MINNIKNPVFINGKLNPNYDKSIPLNNKQDPNCDKFRLTRRELEIIKPDLDKENGWFRENLGE